MPSQPEHVPNGRYVVCDENRKAPNNVDLMPGTMTALQTWGENGECGAAGHGFAERWEAEHFAGVVFKDINKGAHRVVIKDREKGDAIVWVDGASVATH